MSQILDGNALQQVKDLVLSGYPWMQQKLRHARLPCFLKVLTLKASSVSNWSVFASVAP